MSVPVAIQIDARRIHAQAEMALLGLTTGSFVRVDDDLKVDLFEEIVHVDIGLPAQGLQEMKRRFCSYEFSGMLTSEHEHAMIGIFVTKGDELHVDFAAVLRQLAVVDGERCRGRTSFLELVELLTKLVRSVIELCIPKKSQYMILQTIFCCFDENFMHN